MSLSSCQSFRLCTRSLLVLQLGWGCRVSSYIEFVYLDNIWFRVIHPPRSNFLYFWDCRLNSASFAPRLISSVTPLSVVGRFKTPVESVSYRKLTVSPHQIFRSCWEWDLVLPTIAWIRLTVELMASAISVAKMVHLLKSPLLGMSSKCGKWIQVWVSPFYGKDSGTQFLPVVMEGWRSLKLIRASRPFQGTVP